MLDNATLLLLARQNEERRREENFEARTVVVVEAGRVSILDIQDIRKDLPLGVWKADGEPVLLVRE